MRLLFGAFLVLSLVGSACPTNIGLVRFDTSLLHLSRPAFVAWLQPGSFHSATESFPGQYDVYRTANEPLVLFDISCKVTDFKSCESLASPRRLSLDGLVLCVEVAPSLDIYYRNAVRKLLSAWEPSVVVLLYTHADSWGQKGVKQYTNALLKDSHQPAHILEAPYPVSGEPETSGRWALDLLRHQLAPPPADNGAPSDQFVSALFFPQLLQVQPFLLLAVALAVFIVGKLVCSSGASDTTQSSDLEKLLQPIPNSQWDQLFGLEAAKRSLRTIVESTRHRGVLEDPSNIVRRVLLYGPPGTGKTQLAKCLAADFKFKYMEIKIGDVKRKHFGETEQRLLDIFKFAIENQPILLFFDEGNALTPCRTSNESDPLMKSVVEQFLQSINDALKLDVFIVLATNYPLLVDPAVRSRFEEHIYIGLPDKATRKAILTSKQRVHFNLTLTELSTLVSKTEHFSGRNFESLWTKLGGLARAKLFQSEGGPCYFKIAEAGQQTWYEPCNRSDTGATDLSQKPGGSLEYIAKMNGKIKNRLLSYQEVHAAISSIQKDGNLEALQCHADYVRRPLSELQPE